MFYDRIVVRISREQLNNLKQMMRNNQEIESISHAVRILINNARI